MENHNFLTGHKAMKILHILFLQIIGKPLAFIAIAIFGFSASSFAQEKIAVGTVNGETIYLDEVMQLTEELPDEYRRQPLENYYPNLVADQL